MAENNLKQKDKLNKREEILDKYESNIGLPANVPPGPKEELEEFLSMSRDEVEGMTLEKAYSVSYRLSQFSFYIQRSINREKSIIIWAESELSSIVAKELDQYDQYMKYDAKVSLICSQNNAALELKRIITYAKQRCLRLESVSDGLKNMSYVISLIFKFKTGDRT